MIKLLKRTKCAVVPWHHMESNHPQVHFIKSLIKISQVENGITFFKHKESGIKTLLGLGCTNADTVLDICLNPKTLDYKELLAKLELAHNHALGLL